MSTDSRKRERRAKGLVLLKDLVPRKDPKGGAAKPVFGQQPVGPDAARPSPPARQGGKKTK